MNRRGFLRAAGGLAVAAPVAAAAPQVGAILGGEWAGGALAGGAGMGVIQKAPPVWTSLELLNAAGLAAFHRYTDAEWKRARWLEIHRHHRIRVRRGREERKPAKLLWLLEERREAAQRRTGVGGPIVDRKDRISNARVRRLMKAAGFPGLPWEVPCSK